MVAQSKVRALRNTSRMCASCDEKAKALKAARGKVSRELSKINKQRRELHRQKLTQDAMSEDEASNAEDDGDDGDGDGDDSEADVHIIPDGAQTFTSSDEDEDEDDVQAPTKQPKTPASS